MTEEVGISSPENVNTTSTWTSWVEEDRPTIKLGVRGNGSRLANECNSRLLAGRIGVVEGDLRETSSDGGAQEDV